MFTDKAKELFDKYLENFFEQNGHLLEQCVYTDDIEQWKKLPLSMQIGVIEDFAESLGYFIRKDAVWLGVGYYVYTIKQGTKEIFEVQRNDKNEAIEKMIKQLNDLINDHRTGSTGNS